MVNPADSNSDNAVLSPACCWRSRPLHRRRQQPSRPLATTASSNSPPPSTINSSIMPQPVPALKCTSKPKATPRATAAAAPEPAGPEDGDPPASSRSPCLAAGNSWRHVAEAADAGSGPAAGARWRQCRLTSRCS